MGSFRPLEISKRQNESSASRRVHEPDVTVLCDKQRLYHLILFNQRLEGPSRTVSFLGLQSRRFERVVELGWPYPDIIAGYSQQE